ncbi:hypothetical protein [Amycolatopsis sp. FDAARGOS 1241]|uniref:hypothetical protein n=1 Tax=Amycolatopsis sp. FDAARGOS 1241 TaxID=2778070 RepID=UPI00194FEA17|nr:hypothetical protein [Amycolatopsis sp. FDAARGOS 1241]QRP45933.1 hypothetical protein I6J71_43895 [Amycolatopsis sp. FDAARGOS 1241]
MDVWGYPHELEYRREVGAMRVHEYTELVDDMGFVLEHRSERYAGWTVRYGAACAHDFLARQHAKPGSYVVSVFRLFPDARKHVVTLRMNWPAKPAEIHPTEIAALGRR